jgi:hypothetical protein
MKNKLKAEQKGNVVSIEIVATDEDMASRLMDLIEKCLERHNQEERK